MVYENVKAVAKEQGLTISALEKKAGLGNGVIGRWNNSSPTAEKLKAVADVLGVKVDYLLENPHPENREEGEEKIFHDLLTNL